MSSGEEFNKFIDNLANQWRQRPRSELEETIQKLYSEDKRLQGSILYIVYKKLYPDGTLNIRSGPQWLSDDRSSQTSSVTVSMTTSPPNESPSPTLSSSMRASPDSPRISSPPHVCPESPNISSPIQASPAVGSPSALSTSSNYQLSYFRSSSPSRSSSPTKSPTALLLLAEGAEEMETTISVDVLRRCGIEVTIAGVGGSQAVTCARKCRLIPDKALSEASGEYDAIILPGGLEGADNLAASVEVGELLRRQEAANRLICAICAAPIALMAHKIGVGRSVTSHPMKGDELRNAGYKYLDQRVAIDGQFITSRTPGTAFEFTLAIVEKLCGSAKAKEEEAQLMLR